MFKFKVVKLLKKNCQQTLAVETERTPAVTSGFVAFTGHRCPHSFTESITTIFKDEVILSSL